MERKNSFFSLFDRTERLKNCFRKRIFFFLQSPSGVWMLVLIFWTKRKKRQDSAPTWDTQFGYLPYVSTSALGASLNPILRQVPDKIWEALGRLHMAGGYHVGPTEALQPAGGSWRPGGHLRHLWWHWMPMFRQLNWTSSQPSQQTLVVHLSLQ